mgnify:CR=1 FL=1
MKMKLIRMMFILVACFVWGVNDSKAVEVTLTIDEGVDRPAALETAARNLGQVLTEINRAQQAKTILTTNGLPMDEFSLRSLLRLWAVTPFYCDDEEVVERCWVFRDGTMMVSHIPLIITPQEEDFGVGTYQEAIVEFDARGRLTDFRLALDAHLSESLEHCGSVVEKEKQMVIMQYIERFRTAYNQKDIEFIDQLFSDDALIITGTVVTVRPNKDNNFMRQKVVYNKQSKEQYIRNLRKAFARNKWINVKFSEIGDNGETGGCAGITRSEKNRNMYGVRLHQEWNSSTYSDEGYLFLLWEFPENGGSPIIHVRTWQPEWVGGQRQEPDDDISTLGGFNL